MSEWKCTTCFLPIGEGFECEVCKRLGKPYKAIPPIYSQSYLDAAVEKARREGFEAARAHRLSMHGQKFETYETYDDYARTLKGKE